MNRGLHVRNLGLKLRGLDATLLVLHALFLELGQQRLDRLLVHVVPLGELLLGLLAQRQLAPQVRVLLAQDAGPGQQLFRLPALVCQLQAHLLVLHDGSLCRHLQLVVRELHHRDLCLLDLGCRLTLPLLAILDVLSVNICHLLLELEHLCVQGLLQVQQFCLQEILTLQKLLRLPHLLLIFFNAALQLRYLLVLVLPQLGQSFLALLAGLLHLLRHLVHLGLKR
mmetsp:Transcript_12645/g.36920  ORF Transcript_12645/g.36920 Transcript_12645/m.36920 type:complete len:225 (+) Transcript_12645:1248-1922(+)